MADKDPKRSSKAPAGKESGTVRPSVERAMALRDVIKAIGNVIDSDCEPN